MLVSFIFGFIVGQCACVIAFIWVLSNCQRTDKFIDFVVKEHSDRPKHDDDCMI